MPRALIFFLMMTALPVLGFGQYEYSEYDPVEEAVAEAQEPSPPTTNTNIVQVPVFSGMKSYYAVDPQNPQLPPGHWLLKLRGSVWRSQEQVLSTNSRGVVSAQRLYIFFASDRDAVAFEFAPHAVKAPGSIPVFSDYMELNPLIQTNTYKVQPYQYQYLSIDSPYTRQIKPLELSGTFQQTEQIPSEALESSKESEEITEEVAEYDNQSDAYETQYEGQYESQDAYQQEYDDNQNDYYQEYEEIAFHFEFSEQNFVAQQAVLLEQIVVNVGGLQGGIFVHKNKNNKKTPYTVFFLTLEPDGNLWAYTIKTSFDIRRGDSDAVKNARILYEKALKTKANFKKFTRVQIDDSETRPRFFK
ncbi:hypothetical protein SAMN02745150_00299 [Brevinema andersonii]|uniref:Uncharacterized protein n=1 Tax=Brevinema andersonii TaxID=34097 RepID=A0A1I1D5V2_BREAD|nr:hypothetical protein [Brevinema andersonii]SFB69762.1 hypothetical protein SAMN02745150_00299 [Brevinema andersonii]